MPIWIASLGTALGQTLLGMAMSLVTEHFLKKAVILALRQVVARTESDLDDKLLKHAEEVWNEEEK